MNTFALFLYLYLYLYLLFNLYLYLYLYLPKNWVGASIHIAFNDTAWQRINRIRPLNNVAGRISTAHMLRPGWKSCRFGLTEAQVSKRSGHSVEANSVKKVSPRKRPDVIKVLG